MYSEVKSWVRYCVNVVFKYLQCQICRFSNWRRDPSTVCEEARVVDLQNTTRYFTKRKENEITYPKTHWFTWRNKLDFRVSLKISGEVSAYNPTMDQNAVLDC